MHVLNKFFESSRKPVKWWIFLGIYLLIVALFLRGFILNFYDLVHASTLSDTLARLLYTLLTGAACGYFLWDAIKTIQKARR